MNERIATSKDVLVVPAAPEFSWRAVVAGAFVASSVIFFLLFLGTGIGLSLFIVPRADAGAVVRGITLGAVYFFAAQAFGFAVGGYIAGRLMGPVLESESEEVFHASTHGLVAWAVAVVMTATMVAISGFALAGPGLNAAAIIGAASPPDQATASASETTGYWVDTLFRASSGVQTNQTTSTAAGSIVGQRGAAPSAAPIGSGTGSEALARAEVARLLTVGLLHGQFSQADHDQVALLVSRYTGADAMEANRRIDDVQDRIHQDAIAAAEATRKFTRFLSLWLAASLIFGALTAAGAAVSGRWVDDKARAG
jgi:hypothetical protein